MVHKLLSFPEDWVNRRVETIELLGPDTARRRVSVDFALPERINESNVHDKLDVIPVTLMDKAPLRGFDIVDEDNRAQPVASANRGVSLGRAALLALAKEVLDLDRLHEAVWADLYAIHGGDEDLTRRHLKRMSLAARPGFEAELADYLRRLPVAEQAAFELL